MTSLYDFSVLNQDNQETPLETYRGKILLVVNTATGCGLTPQYQGLRELYDRYQEQGFEILDFPCNQFIKPPSHVLPRSKSTVRRQIPSMFG